MNKKKRIFSLVIFVFFSLNINAQVSFSCKYQEICNWNLETEEFENCEGHEENSIFKMNSDESSFTHTDEQMQSIYYVTSKEYDSENDVKTYIVTSDAGNEYYFIFDTKNKEIRVVFNQEERTLLITFTIE
jgi:hypothetical protein